MFSKDRQQAAVVAADIQHLLAAEIAIFCDAGSGQTAHAVEHIEGLARAIMVVLRKQVLFRNLKPLMPGTAGIAEQDFDGVFPADARVADRNQIVAQGMFAEVEHRPQRYGSADLAAVDFAQSRMIRAATSGRGAMSVAPSYAVPPRMTRSPCGNR